MIADIVIQQIHEQQQLLGRPLCLDEVVDLTDEPRHEVWKMLETACDDGYLFFDGEVVMVLR